VRMNTLFQVYRDGTIEGRISPRSFSTATTPQQRVTLQAPTLGEVTPDYLKVQYRALSQALVWQEGWLGMVVTDFSQGEILKASTPLLEGVTVMPDHKFSAEDYLGIVEQALWTDSVNGIPVAGIDAIYKLDIDPDPSHPSRRIIRGVQQGYIRGSSVRVWFDYEKSHPELDDWTFYEAMGKDVDGHIVRFIATHIRRFLETSIVIAGADPLAAPVDEVEDGQHGELAASFSRSGWHVPDTPARLALSINPLHEEPPMKRKNKKLDVQDMDDQAEQLDLAQDTPEANDVADDPVVTEEPAVMEDTPPEPVDVPDEEIIPALGPEEDDEAEEIPEDIEEDTIAMSSEELGAVTDAVLKEQEAVFAAELDAIKAERDAALADKAATERRFALDAFYRDLKAQGLPASFDALHIVEGLMALSQTPSIPHGDQTISPVAWAQALIVEAAKFAQVPTGRLTDQAKAPEDQARDRQAALDDAVKTKMEANPKLSARLAMKELAGERPELFHTR